MWDVSVADLPLAARYGRAPRSNPIRIKIRSHQDGPRGAFCAHNLEPEAQPAPFCQNGLTHTSATCPFPRTRRAATSSQHESLRSLCSDVHLDETGPEFGLELEELPPGDACRLQTDGLAKYNRRALRRANDGLNPRGRPTSPAGVCSDAVSFERTRALGVY